VPNADELKGRTKEAAGSLTGDQGLKNEGRTDQAAGKAEQAVDDAKDAVGGAADKLKGAIKRD
jgi:uncharacterized protein YjbJ (UPF0337 family)